MSFRLMAFIILTGVIVALQSSLEVVADGSTNAVTPVQIRDPIILRRDKLQDLKWPQEAEEFVAGAQALEKDVPKSPVGYELMMEAIDNYESFHELDKARSLAEEMAQSHIPPRYRAWAEGYIRRSDALGKPISIRFAAVDDRTVDLAAMRGKVVLVDFWATGCHPCVAELPAVKAAYDRLHERGFEVIGISCDTDKGRLLNFTKKNGYSWPEYFDGKQQADNKFTQQFGIDGIPHMFLVDCQGKLRVDGLSAKGGFETQIEKLLDESQN